VSIKYLTHGAAQIQVREPDDARTGSDLPVASARGHGGDSVDKLGLSDRSELFGTVDPKHTAAFDEDGGNDAMATLRVREELIQEIATVGMVPEMVVGVADRAFRLDDALGDLS
jgi:hypothetical protein